MCPFVWGVARATVVHILMRISTATGAFLAFCSEVFVVVAKAVILAIVAETCMVVITMKRAVVIAGILRSSTLRIVDRRIDT